MGDALPDFDLDGYLPYRMAVIASLLSKGLADQYRKRFGITVAEWRVLLNVGYSDKVSVRDIERRVSLEKSKVSRAATRLEEAGYLSKCVDESDRRLLRLTLTDKGVQLLTEIVPLAQSYQEEVKAMLDGKFDALQDALGTLMKKNDL